MVVVEAVEGGRAKVVSHPVHDTTPYYLMLNGPLKKMIAPAFTSI